jgi:hypothetical protein
LADKNNTDHNRSEVDWSESYLHKFGILVINFGSEDRDISCTDSYTGEDHLVDVANFDQSREFRDEEDITFKEEEITLNGFEISFVTWVSVSARRGLGFHLSTK